MKGNKFLHFSGMAVQMIAVIGIFAFAGTKLDARFGTDSGWTAGLALLGVIVAMYMVFRDLSRMQ